MSHRTLEELDGSEAKLMLLDLPAMDVDRVRKESSLVNLQLIDGHRSSYRMRLTSGFRSRCQERFRRTDKCMEYDNYSNVAEIMWRMA